jgi:hypothetical protein
VARRPVGRPCSSRGVGDLRRTEALIGPVRALTRRGPELRRVPYMLADLSINPHSQLVVYS